MQYFEIFFLILLRKKVAIFYLNCLQRRQPLWKRNAIFCTKQESNQHTAVLFTTLWAYSADNKLVIFFLFFPENRIWHFMQIVSTEDNLHEMSYPVFWEKNNQENVSIYCLLKIYPLHCNAKRLPKTKDLIKYFNCHRWENVPVLS